MEDLLAVLIPVAFDVALLAILAVIGWAIPRYLQPFLGAKITAQLIEVLNEAIESAFYDAERNGLKAGSAEFIRHMRVYVKQSIPDTLARISPLPDALDRKIAAGMQKMIEQRLARMGVPG